jgi:hypothetical protein
MTLIKEIVEKEKKQWISRGFLSHPSLIDITTRLTAALISPDAQ